MVGFVSIVGAGPWDPELLTLAGLDRLGQADVVVADYLVNPALLMHCKPNVEIIQREAGPRAGALLDQERINTLLVEHARTGARVVRLKGGDPCMFGRGGEEAQHLRRHGIPYELVPGVSSPIAAPEYAGIPVTHRDHTPAVTFVSGYEAYDKAGLQVAWEHLAKSAGTIVLMMGVKNAGENCRRLMAAGRDPSTPAAAIRWGTRGIQRTIVAPLSEIADRIAREGLRPPAILVVGDVVNLRDELQWFETLPLFGRRVVVTRSSRQSGRLVHMLAAQGADAVAFPCLEVVPPEDPEPLRSAASALDRFDGIVFSSPNGVQAFFAALSETGADARRLAGKLVAVVGTGTAEACLAHGIRPDVVPKSARAEGLVEVLRQRGDLAAHWLHVRADEGRELLGEAITAAGGTYRLVIGYRTIRPDVPELLLRSLASPQDGGEGFDAVCFASGKTARHFLETLTERFGAPKAHRLLAASKVVTIGPVTTEALNAAGIRVDATANRPTDASILEAVLAVLQPG